MVTAALTAMVLVHPWLARHSSSEKAVYADSRAAERAYTSFWLDVLAPRPMAYERQMSPAASEIAR
jgi:hypothetical protein